ncbi:MAG: ArgE/DapE family deacylase [Candidatus Hodarchaeales archaeon]|jgi:acetylornithine deacetylase/succinyl-diaminopimelate desuccinylase family protein
MNDTIKSQIFEAIENNKNEILDFTKELVAIATENPPGSHYNQCVELISQKLSDIGLINEIIEVPSLNSNNETEDHPRYCIRSFFGTGTQTLYFHGHYDVVPSSNKEQFQPIVQKGKLFGRGSSDMKGGLASMIYAIKIIKESNIPLNGRIGLIIVHDEETGGVMGSKFLSDKEILGQDGIGMLLPEPTSGVIWNANRGAVSLKLTVKGKPAHVALQYQGINAFENMLEVANKLRELKKEVEMATTNFNIKPVAAKSSILMLGGRCEGGTNFNLVPGEVSFTIDRRINPEENFDEEKQKLFDFLESLKNEGYNIDIEIIQEGESSGSSEDDLLAQILSRNIETIIGKKPEFEMCPGLLETRFYAKKGIPAFAYGPGLLSVSHGPNEFVNINDIFNCTGIYALTAIEFLSTVK